MRRILFAALASLAAAPAAAQLSLVREPIIIATDAPGARTLAKVRADLAALRTAQEAHFAAQSRYATDVGELTEFTPVSGATLVIVAASADAWAVTASHPALRGTETLRIAREPAKGGTGAGMMAGGMMGMMGGAGHEHGGMGGGRMPGMGAVGDMGSCPMMEGKGAAPKGDAGGHKH
ncbi:MAG: hypothetical protein NW201_10625 [Gemmatimonadales bacterium]|nr:hypothetical protein [Gemmatimonadales bacterium]